MCHGLLVTMTPVSCYTILCRTRKCFKVTLSTLGKGAQAPDKQQSLTNSSTRTNHTAPLVAMHNEPIPHTVAVPHTAAQLPSSPAHTQASPLLLNCTQVTTIMLPSCHTCNSWDSKLVRGSSPHQHSQRVNIQHIQVPASNNE
jgi:hypothetical protein